MSSNITCSPSGMMEPEFFFPRSEDEFRKIISCMYSVLDHSLYSDDRSRELFSVKTRIFSFVLKDFIKKRNVHLDEQKSILLENELKKIDSTLVPSHKLYDYTVTVMDIAGIKSNLNDKVRCNYDFILNEPEFSFLEEKKLLRKNINCYMFDAMAIYLMINYIHKNWNTFTPSEDSEKFCEDFVSLHKSYRFSENNVLVEAEKYTKNANFDKTKLILFYEDLYKKIVKFYHTWWPIKNTNLEEIVFLKNLKNNEDEIKPGTLIKITNGIVVNLEFMETKSSYRKHLYKDTFILYILCTETGILYSTLISVYRNSIDNTKAPPPRISKRKKNYNDFCYQLKLGMRLNVSGRVLHKVMIPLFFAKNKKLFKFEPVRITHARFSFPKTANKTNKKTP